MTRADSKNPRIWVNRAGDFKYILKTALPDFLAAGWEKGRPGYKAKRKYNKRTR